MSNNTSMTPKEKLRCYAERVGMMGQDVDYIIAIIRAAVLAERNACLALCSPHPNGGNEKLGSEIAAAIRARKDA